MSVFRNETFTAFTFRECDASIIKNRPARGGFLFQLVLCGPNTKLCRWYRTFFEILLRFPAFFGPRGGACRVSLLDAPLQASRQIAQRGSCQRVVKAACRADERFLAAGRSARLLDFGSGG